jgi:hypothetical protein
MANRANKQAPQRPNSALRVRWVEVEVNGADATIEEALRVVERMRRPIVQAAAEPKRIANTQASGNGDEVPPQDSNTLEGGEDIESGVAGADSFAATDDISAGETLRKKRGEGDRKDYNAGIRPVGDIDFFPAGKQSLKEFFSQKAPKSDMDQILAICHFLQHTLESSQVGPGHILSGLKHVGHPVPKDLRKTIRNMKDKKAWLNFTDIENIRMTTEGENRVEYELGKASADAGAQ